MHICDNSEPQATFTSYFLLLFNFSEPKTSTTEDNKLQLLISDMLQPIHDKMRAYR